MLVPQDLSVRQHSPEPCMSCADLTSQNASLCNCLFCRSFWLLNNLVKVQWECITRRQTGRCWIYHVTCPRQVIYRFWEVWLNEPWFAAVDLVQSHCGGNAHEGSWNLQWFSGSMTLNKCMSYTSNFSTSSYCLSNVPTKPFNIFLVLTFASAIWLFI